MKRVICILLGLLMLLSLMGCGKSEKQADLYKYIEVDMAELAKLEEKMIKSYESVTGENYASDYDTYVELSEITIVLARELNDEVLDLSYEINDDELLEVHRIYMNYCSKFLSALGMIITAIENQDYTQISEANEKLNEANNFALDYRRALDDLAEKYDY